jgi:hypothetical protein
MRSSDYTYNWNAIEPGTSVKIAGERGQFVFRKVDRNGDVEVFGGSSGRLMVRTFRADRVRVKGHRRKVVEQ